MIRDISRYLTKPCKVRVSHVGIELEGAWTKLPPKTAIQQDVSVRLGVVPVPVAIGEIASEPLTLAEWPAWLRDTYPHYHNGTCGMHVHMSFKRRSYYHLLMTRDYMDTLIHYLLNWATTKGFPANHPIWPRIRGENRFCVHEFHADAQTKYTAKDDVRRRTFVNYPYRMHATVECRGLPMFPDVKDAEDGIAQVILVTNAFLAKSVREKPAKCSLTMSGALQGSYEESVECV